VLPYSHQEVGGRSLLHDSYDERRRLLEATLTSGDTWALAPSFTEFAGAEVLQAALDLGMEGVVAKRRASTYFPGRRSPDWVKTKPEHTQEVVIGG
jgi:bifunctional non-homologous end joining protein LigD